jgi:PHP domain-containing protein
MRKTLSALALLLASTPFAAEPQAVRVHYDPKDRETGRYQYVPFEVSPGTTRIDLEYAYDRAGGTNVVDLGLFEPGSLDLGTPGFRGWSGGERARISVGIASATPGYWPGPLPAGRWNVMLGLYKVAPSGVDVDVKVTLGSAPEDPAPALPPAPPEPVRRGPAWYSGGLHLHTVHSDGTVTARELARLAKAAGLEFIAITDHNNTAHQLEGDLDEGLLHIVGEEVTTPGGHASVWGLRGWRAYVDFRVLAGDPRIADLVQAAEARGALFSVNHPRASCVGCGWEHAIPSGVVGLEVANNRPEERAASIALWDSLLRGGRRITGIGSSDWHRGPGPIDAASVRVWAPELSTAAILDGIRNGRVVIMADGKTPPPVLTARFRGTVARIGETLKVPPGQRYQVEIVAPADAAFERGRADLFWSGEKAGSAPLHSGHAARFSRAATADGYLRAHVYRADGAIMAITNPVYIAADKGR